MEVRYQSELKWNLQENYFYVPTTTSDSYYSPFLCNEFGKKVVALQQQKSGQTILV